MECRGRDRTRCSAAIALGNHARRAGRPRRDQSIRFFRVYRPPGTLEGFFWLGQKDQLIGFIPVDGTVESQSGAIVVGALQASAGDGREAFKF